MNYLGIDWGKEKIGLAIADEETRMAFGHDTLLNDKGIFERIAEIIKKENVSKVIVGIPSYINRGQVEYEAERFGKALEERLDITVVYENEMFTTKMARENLSQKGMKGLENLDDKEAARIILQNWLDRQKTGG